MASADIPNPRPDNHDDESHHISERLPLLQESTKIAVDTSVPSETLCIIPPRRKQCIILLLCAFAFIMMLGDNLQPAALIQTYEAIICDDYYRAHPSLPIPNTTSPTQPLVNNCKIQPVQKELALVRGFQQLVPLFSALLCTVPYGLLAERIGRKPVLILSGAGTFAALSWVLAVCYLRFASIRWVLFSGVFLFIGGGDAVTSSIIHVMVTDTIDQTQRAQTFLYLHAADVVSGFFGPAISALLMEKGHTWAVLLLAEVVIFSSTFILSQFIPETLSFRNKSSGDPDSISDLTSPQATILPSSRPATSVSTRIANRIPFGVSRLVAPLLSVLASNRQALLLLVIFAPQTTARELFTVIGLQYSNAKYSLSYARGNVLLSLFQGAQGLFVLVLLPLITRTVAEPRGWSPWARDRRYAILSIAVTALGLMVIGLAPALVIEATGLLLVALGSCTTGLLMSLLGTAVRPNQVSTIYSAALTLSIMMRSVTGLVASALLVEGLELGGNWMGMPFVAMAMLMAGMAITSGFIRTERVEDTSEE
ncbi:MAG: hypothetical protein Q9163_002446 [Psora crenata]